MSDEEVLSFDMYVRFFLLTVCDKEGYQKNWFEKKLQPVHLWGA